MILEASLEICEDLSLGSISESPWEYKYNELPMERTQCTSNSQLSQKRQENNVKQSKILGFRFDKG
jgi:hypothetical protein